MLGKITVTLALDKQTSEIRNSGGRKIWWCTCELGDVEQEGVGL